MRIMSSSLDTDNDPFSTDEDSDYVPEDNDLYSENNNTFSDSEHEAVKPFTSNETHVTPKRARKRARKPNTWKKNILKQQRLRGEEYITKGKLRRKKECKEIVHTCRYDCKQFTQEERLRVFSKFYGLSNAALQNQFLSSCITKTAVKKKKEGGNKSYSTAVYLLNRRVCREFFLKTLDISDGKFKIICKKTDSDNFVESDRRGHTPAKNKISESARNAVINHIKRFPRYKSHYSRSQNPNTRYLSPDLNIRKMYSLYKEDCEVQKLTPVKESYYRSIFNTEFNLRFHYPHSDTCNRCDKYKNLISNATDEEVKKKYESELELHHRQAKKAVDSKAKDIKESREVDDTVTICFDLQKTLPTPLLTTNKVYYLRQLWTYNLCIFNLTTGTPNMFVWNESVASRGSQEIGSCLLKFMKSLPPNITKVIAYSDACSGQKKNKNISKLFMHYVCSTRITEIHHKFFESGHSYMECDRSFGIIEKRRKMNPQVFLPSHWENLIQQCSKNFEIVHMKKEDFLSFSATLNNIIKDPKKDSEKGLLKWREIKWFLYQADLGYSFKFKKTLDQDFVSFSLSENCKVISHGRPAKNITFTELYPEGIKIKFLKWQNLQELLEFIPPIYQDFYRNMAHEKKENKRSLPKKEKQTAPGTSKKASQVHETKKETEKIFIKSKPLEIPSDEEEPNADYEILESDYE